MSAREVIAMELLDKRLFNRLDQSQQEKYLKEILKHLSDARGKLETVEIAHEPIRLLQKKKLCQTSEALPSQHQQNEQPEA